MTPRLHPIGAWLTGLALAYGCAQHPAEERYPAEYLDTLEDWLRALGP